MIAGGEGTNRVFDDVHVFDGSKWTEGTSLSRARHGVSLAVDCTCNQIHIASGSPSAKGGAQLTSIETYFVDGVDTKCPA